MDKNLSNQKQHSQQLHQQQQQTKLNELDESITSSQSFNQISSISTTDSKNSMNSTEKKATHSEIEKRRRQKMNKHLNELAFHLPGVNTKNKKPDKLTILKLAVQHLKNLKASNSLLNDSFICQNFMKPIELQSLVLNETEEFFIVIKCDSSKIVFVSDSCAHSIGFSSNDLIDKSFYDFTHSSDHKQIKEQLNYQETSNNNPVDSTNNYTNNRKKLYTTGDRRSFLCRIRNCLNEVNKNLKPVNQLCVYTEPDFKLAHFVGYMRSDFAAKYDNSNANTENQPTNLDDANDQCTSSTYMSSEHCYSPSFSNQLDDDQHQQQQQPQQKRNLQQQQQSQQKIISSVLNEPSQCSGHFLLAYAQIRSKVNELDLQTRFITKHDADGKFIYIEPSIYPILGYLPQQLLSESIFSFVHLDDVQMLKKVYQEAILTSPAKLKTPEYRVKLENNKSFAIIESVIFALKNPFTNSLEYIVSQNKFCSISLITNSSSYLSQQQQQQQQLQQQKKKIINSPMNSTLANISMPMTPSPEDNPSPEMIKYNESIHGKKLPTTNARPKSATLASTNSNIPVGFNSKLKPKNSMFQIDANNNMLIDSEMNSTQLNILSIASVENQNDIFKSSQQQQQQQQQRSSQDSFISFTSNANLTSQDNNLYNESLFDINDNFNDILTKNHSVSQSASIDTSKGQNVSNQNSYNLMLKNNTVQENTEMLMEILKNEKSFQSSSLVSNNEKS